MFRFSTEKQVGRNAEGKTNLDFVPAKMRSKEKISTTLPIVSRVQLPLESIGERVYHKKVVMARYRTFLEGQQRPTNANTSKRLGYPLADRLEEAVSHVTGRDFYFVFEDSPKLQLRVTWGEKRMFLSHLPVGLRSIIVWLVACVAKIESFHPAEENPLDLPVVLIIDEPESHLHPAWQRKLMPTLQHLLPKAQIFVATHSPFVISSVNHGFYYVLRADEEGVVTIDPAKPCSKGDTYLDVVQDILGVQEWYDVETEEQLAQFRSARDIAKRTSTEANIEAMRALALRISERSESLKDMMARELSQFDRQLAAVSGRSDK